MVKMFSKRQNQILTNMNVVLHNVFVLYFILLLSLTNLFYLVTAKNYLFTSIFILTGFITSFFSKNMMVILCIALTVTNVLQFGNKSIEEGFKSDNIVKTVDIDDDTSSDEEMPISTVKTSTPKSIVNTSVNNEDNEDNEVKLASLEKQYNKLLTLQETISKNMQNITEPLAEAEGIVNNMAKTLGLQGMN